MKTIFANRYAKPSEKWIAEYDLECAGWTNYDRESDKLIARLGVTATIDNITSDRRFCLMDSNSIVRLSGYLTGYRVCVSNVIDQLTTRELSVYDIEALSDASSAAWHWDRRDEYVVIGYYDGAGWRFDADTADRAKSQKYDVLLTARDVAAVNALIAAGEVEFDGTDGDNDMRIAITHGDDSPAVVVFKFGNLMSEAI